MPSHRLTDSVVSAFTDALRFSGQKNQRQIVEYEKKEIVGKGNDYPSFSENEEFYRIIRSTEISSGGLEEEINEYKEYWPDENLHEQVFGAKKHTQIEVGKKYLKITCGELVIEEGYDIKYREEIIPFPCELHIKKEKLEKPLQDASEDFEKIFFLEISLWERTKSKKQESDNYLGSSQFSITEAGVKIRCKDPEKDVDALINMVPKRMSKYPVDESVNQNANLPSASSLELLDIREKSNLSCGQ